MKKLYENKRQEIKSEDNKESNVAEENDSDEEDLFNSDEVIKSEQENLAPEKAMSDDNKYVLEADESDSSIQEDTFGTKEKTHLIEANMNRAKENLGVGVKNDNESENERCILGTKACNVHCLMKGKRYGRCIHGKCHCY